MAKLSDNVRYIKGIGEARAASLSKLGISTVRDLISFFPRTYEDRTHALPVALLTDGQAACIQIMVSSEPTLSRVRRGMELVKLRGVDDSGSIDITYFNQSYVRRQFKAGESYVLYGRVSVEGNRRSMVNPLFEPAATAGTFTGRLVPIYRLTAGISQKVLTAAMRQGLDACDGIFPDAVPAHVAEKRQLCQCAYAYENIHFPSELSALEPARRRLIFEELFVLSCGLSRIKSSRSKAGGLVVSTPPLEEFYSKLPFVATGAQKRAITQAAEDMRSGCIMSRLIQGDVGSGKTLVAAACCWLAFRGGLQSAFMAPTEILAHQHYESLTALLSPLGLRVVLLTGSMGAKQKRQALEQISSGEGNLIIGTHALISQNVDFCRLGLVITDEQHRFGVSQRSALSSKGKSPHVLIMSATPIPRTLALMIYGDLDVSIIDELPPGRQPIDTFAVGEDMRQRIYRFMEKQVGEGRQVMVVCPAIDENQEQPLGVKTVSEHYVNLKNNIFPNLRVGCVHGKMKAAEKEQVMADFAAGLLDVLVSTTVIEVGVDIPNASLMVVENAERFGLSQLHQLRGRVGRGRHKSYCVLFSSSDSQASRSRLSVMEKTNNGFVIAEEDLKLRGPGDFFGERQHGLPEMRIADLCTDLNILNEAREAAQELLARDPSLEAPENAGLRQRINELFEQKQL